jgi:hypothetical protein
MTIAPRVKVRVRCHGRPTCVRHFRFSAENFQSLHFNAIRWFCEKIAKNILASRLILNFFLHMTKVGPPKKPWKVNNNPNGGKSTNLVTLTNISAKISFCSQTYECMYAHVCTHIRTYGNSCTAAMAWTGFTEAGF